MTKHVSPAGLHSSSLLDTLQLVPVASRGSRYRSPGQYAVMKLKADSRKDHLLLLQRLVL